MDFTLRPWEMADLNSLVKYANNSNISKYLTDRFPFPYTEVDGRTFISFASAAKPVHVFAIEINHEAAGGIGIHPQQDIFQKNAELGYWLAEPFWGNGIISKAIVQIMDIAFTEFDIERLFARPFGNNIASQKVLEKNNFRLEARFEKTIFKNGEYQDELVYANRREMWEKAKEIQQS